MSRYPNTKRAICFDAVPVGSAVENRLPWAPILTPAKNYADSISNIASAAGMEQQLFIASSLPSSADSLTPPPVRRQTGACPNYSSRNLPPISTISTSTATSLEMCLIKHPPSSSDPSIPSHPLDDSCPNQNNPNPTFPTSFPNATKPLYSTTSPNPTSPLNSEGAAFTPSLPLLPHHPTDPTSSHGLNPSNASNARSTFGHTKACLSAQLVAHAHQTSNQESVPPKNSQTACNQALSLTFRTSPFRRAPSDLESGDEDSPPSSPNFDGSVSRARQRPWEGSRRQLRGGLLQGGLLPFARVVHAPSTLQVGENPTNPNLPHNHSPNNHNNLLDHLASVRDYNPKHPQECVASQKPSVPLTITGVVSSGEGMSSSARSATDAGGLVPRGATEIKTIAVGTTPSTPSTPASSSREPAAHAPISTSSINATALAVTTCSAEFPAALGPTARRAMLVAAAPEAHKATAMPGARADRGAAISEADATSLHGVHRGLSPPPDAPPTAAQTSSCTSAGAVAKSPPRFSLTLKMGLSGGAVPLPASERACHAATPTALATTSESAGKLISVYTSGRPPPALPGAPSAPAIGLVDTEPVTGESGTMNSSISGRVDRTKVTPSPSLVSEGKSRSTSLTFVAAATDHKRPAKADVVVSLCSDDEESSIESSCDIDMTIIRRPQAKPTPDVLDRKLSSLSTPPIQRAGKTSSTARADDERREATTSPTTRAAENEVWRRNEPGTLNRLDRDRKEFALEKKSPIARESAAPKSKAAEVAMHT